MPLYDLSAAISSLVYLKHINIRPARLLRPLRRPSTPFRIKRPSPANHRQAWTPYTSIKPFPPASQLPLPFFPQLLPGCSIKRTNSDHSIALAAE
jgi:hypothetical protein